jgi:predicted amidohydrolase YtcJ
MSRPRRTLLALIAVAIGIAAWFAPRRPPAVLYVGGPILTMDADNRVAEALLTDGARITAVGRAADVQPLAGSATRVVNLAGHALLPGFIDAHSHFPGAGLTAVFADLASPPVGSVSTIAELQARLEAQATHIGAGKWVVGVGYDDTLLRDQRHPTRADLDRVSTQQPVGIVHVSAHLAVVNSLGLERLGVTRASPDPPGGRIQRDPTTGEPTGVLEESAAQGVIDRLRQPSLLDALKMVRRANELYLAAGVTTAQNGYTGTRDMNSLSQASRLGLVSMRLVFWPEADAAAGMPADTPWLSHGAVKLIGDGSIQGYTAYLTKPYFKPPGTDADYRGYPRWPRAALTEQVIRWHRDGRQIAVHGNGDAAIDDILDAFEAAQRAAPRADTRHVIVHAQMARDDQLDRMQRLGVIPSFFVLHTYYWGDRHRDIFLGPERAARISPTRSALERGIRFTLHADTPVSPMEPLRMVWAAVNRRTTSGVVLGPAERIAPMQALRAVTIDAAYQHFTEHDTGSLEPGKLADLVIVDRSPLADPEHIDQIRVLETIVGGRTAYRDKP